MTTTAPARLVAKLRERQRGGGDGAGDRPVSARVDGLGPTVRPHGRDRVVEAHEAGRPARTGAGQRRAESRLHAGHASLDLEPGGGERVAEVARALVLLVPQLGMVVDEPAHLRDGPGLRGNGVQHRRGRSSDRLPQRSARRAPSRAAPCSRRSPWRRRQARRPRPRAHLPSTARAVELRRQARRPELPRPRATGQAARPPSRRLRGPRPRRRRRLARGRRPWPSAARGTRTSRGRPPRPRASGGTAPPSSSSPCSSARLVRADDELGDRQPPRLPPPRRHSTSASTASRNVAGSECGSEKQRFPPSVPTSRTRRLATPRSIVARAGSRSWTTAERSSSRCVTAAPTTSVPFSARTPRKLLDALEVDEVAERGEAELEQQEQLGTAAVERGVLAVTRRELRRLLERARAVQLEGRQRHAMTGARLREHLQRGLDPVADLHGDAEVGERAADRQQTRRRGRATAPSAPCGRCGRGCPAPWPPEIITP